MRLPLDDIARAAGVKFTPVAGWEKRGGEYPATPPMCVVHADASSSKSGTKGGLYSVVNGSQTAPPPVANYQIGRDGHVYLVASGWAYNAGSGNARKLGHPEWDWNGETVGFEAANNNLGEEWTPVQMEAYRRLVFATHAWLALRRGISIASQLKNTLGHKEWSTTGKSDPSFNMDTFRKQIQAMAIKKKTPAELDAEYAAQWPWSRWFLRYSPRLLPLIKKVAVLETQNAELKKAVAALSVRVDNMTKEKVQ